MNTQQTNSIPSHCDGCEKKCKYGYVRIDGGKMLPTINGEEHEYFIRQDGNITSAAVSTPLYAQQLAHIIAKSCNQYKR